MGRCHGEVEEKRFIVCGTFGDVGVCFFCPGGQQLFKVPIGHCGAGCAGLVVAEQACGQEFGRGADCAVIFDKAVGWPVGHVDTKVIIEASGCGAAGGGFGEGFLPKGFLCFCCVVVAGKVLGVVFVAVGNEVFGDFKVPSHSEVPFANAAGVVAVFFEERWYCDAVLINERIAIEFYNARLEAGAPIVTPSE